jgi:DNA primase
MRLSQVGIPAVALLGTTLSACQAELLAQREQVVLLLDGDTAGRRGAREAAARLEMSVDVAIVTLPAGADPDDLPDPALLDLLG